MTFTSYAPNSEDVPLWRALRDVTGGTYVDCGSEPASGASVTRAFYDRGWHGLSTRPGSDQVAQLAALRPRDTVLSSGDLTGLAASLPPCVHFARIDADDEHTSRLLEVVAPASPWIVLIRADNPTSGAALATVGYHHVLYDGVNRFFVSPDQPLRAEQLRAPANIRDDYVRAGDTSLATRLAVAEAALDIAQVQVEGRARQLLDAVRAAGQARNDLRAMAEGSAWLRGLADQARDGEAKLRAEAAWLREQLAAERSEMLGQLLLRADQVGWLQECLASSEVRLSAERALTAHAEHRARLAEAAIANSRVLRAARALRGARPKALAAAPQQGPEQPPAVTIALPAAAMPNAAAATPNGAPPAITAPLPKLPPTLGEPPSSPARPSAPYQPPLPPITTVHQFHAGSAMGDAITNAMLLIRSLLRAQGFESEIFVQSRAAGLGNEIQLLAAMPRHDRIVLLVHHSMGFPGFDEVLALPARKVLIYHNITPPELLTAVPYIEQMSMLGRQQLATWRDHVAFALAVSDYNAVELHSLGFAAVRTCTLLFDIDAVVADPAAARHEDGAFTVLFVGRVTPAKAQHDLIEAFAWFRGQLGRPCRLVLVGALNADEYRYLEHLDDRMAALGIKADVQLTGLISDRELQGWYRQADLYVSLSHHEGFGVPLVEAMAHGVPVLAWPAGAVPYTLGGWGVLLASREPALVADAMLAAATSAASRAAAAAGVAVTQRWALGRHLPILMDALAVAGAVPPASTATRARLADHVRVTFAGAFDEADNLAPGLARLNRSLARTIEAQRPGRVRLLVVKDERCSDYTIRPDADSVFIQALADRPDHESGPVLVLSSHSPLYVPPIRGDLLAAMVACEETLIPEAMVSVLNAQFDAVFVPSRYVAKALVDSGVSVPVLNVGPVPDDLGAIRAATHSADFTGRLAAATAALLLAPKRPAMRVAWITPWQVRCGIAEYSRALVDALPRERVANLTILADDRSQPDHRVQCAWRLGDDAGNPDRLATAIAQADADVVVMQHQPGLMPWSVLAAVLDRLAGERSRPRVILLTLHNTRHLLTIDEAARRAVVAALRRVARILVHTLADVDLLDSLGLIEQATLLPHPAPMAGPAAITVRALPSDAAPVVGSTGFFLPDKGLGALVAAVASLRRHWPGIRLRLVNAEYDDPASAAEIAACRHLAESEGLAVEWHTNFIPLEQQAELLAGCDLLVLPYQRSLEASSAAMRNALGSLVPVAVTPLPLFEEAGDAVFRLAGMECRALAMGIEELLLDPGKRLRLQDAAATWLRPRAAADVARRLHGLMLGLVTARAGDTPLNGSLWRAP